MFIFAIGLEVVPDWLRLYSRHICQIGRAGHSLKMWLITPSYLYFCASVVQIGGFLVNMRNNMINLLAEDYITMAKGKGLSENRVVFNYAARNALAT